jgi:branched-chain amino acid transport system substrate-binding protein
LIGEDTVDAGMAVQKATKLLEKDKVDFTGGEISSASGQAEMEVAAKFKKLFLNTGCNSNELRQAKCSRYGFHVEGASTLFVTATCKQIFAAKNPKKWYFVTSDYAFGHDLYKTASGFVTKNGGTDTGNEMIPTGTTDFSAYLLKIKSANPEIVFNCLAGTDLSIFTKQFKDMGMTMDLGSPDWNTVAMWGAGHAALPSAAMGTTVFYYTANVPNSKAFVDRFMKKFGKPPGSPAWNDYAGVKILAEAVDKTGGTDTNKIIEFLESGYEFDILKSRKGRFTKWDHQLLQPLYLVRPKKAADVKDEYDILDIVTEAPEASATLESIYLPEADNACKFPAL